MSNRLDVLKKSLEKKEAELAKKFELHFADVASANGQPLNDKRNGQATLNRWERQSNAIKNLKQSIEKSKDAIQREEWKIKDCQAVKDKIPAEILKLLETGELIQWRKHPEFFFVKGVERGRIIYKDGVLYHRYVNEIPNDQYAKFRDIFNELKRKLNNQQL